MTGPDRDTGEQQHGNVFGRGWGNMFIHVQRESGLAHRTLVLRPWQVQALRLVASRWFAAVLTVSLLSWAYFAVQTARVPFLTRRISHLEQDAAKIDTLQATLEQLQRRYDQVQQMLSASTRSAPPAPPASSVTPSTTAPRATPVRSTPDKAPAKAVNKTPDTVPIKTPVKTPAVVPPKAPEKTPPPVH